MPNILTPKHLQLSLCFFIALNISPLSADAINSKFDLNTHILDNKLEKKLPPSTTKKTKKPTKNPAKNSTYTLKRGDNLYKVLAKNYGITGTRAYSLVKEIKHLNNLSDIHRLKIGLSIIIPPINQLEMYKTNYKNKVSSKKLIKAGKTTALKPGISHQLRMLRTTRNIKTTSLETVQQIWSQLIPSIGLTNNEPFDFDDRNFSLSLDSNKYPTFPTPDGGRILLDLQGTLPSLVKSLIQNKDPMVRVVSEYPANRRSFFKSLLTAARFHSVKNNFSVEFGSDPKIKVNADFKIEKTPESLLKNDIVLLNVYDSNKPMPEVLVSFLENKGFKMIEASPSYHKNRNLRNHQLYQITAIEPQKIADSLLEALSVPFDTDRKIDIYALEDLGVRLEVRVDRYFEDNGQHFVMSQFNGDPVNYTLVRLLETKGYKVIMLNSGDNFRSIVKKVFPRIRIPARYRKHDLWPIRDLGYGIQMSGVTIHDRGKVGENIFLTDRKMTPLIKTLANLNGYAVINNQ